MSQRFFFIPQFSDISQAVRYNKDMDRILDKVIILLACLATLLFMPFSTFFLIAFLCAIVVGFLNESKIVPELASIISIGSYLVVSFFVAEFVLFIPLMAYGYLSKKSWFYRLIWIVPLITGMRFFDFLEILFLLLVSAASILLSWRTATVDTELQASKTLRDSLREESLSLEQRNQDLREKQDMEVHLAMLNERGRIAREIHDNVGHLLTRSILQVEAYKVIHKDDAVREEFEQVGDTLHEALDTVRTSVHDLYDDAFDLHAQLQRTIKAATRLEIDLDYSIETIASPIGYCFIALTREAISNTLKHSNADRLTIAAIEQPGFYRLTLVDNGSKHAHDAPRMHIDRSREEHSISEGIGLRTMDERVRGLGGIFRIDDREGFKITASIPKQKEAEANESEY